MDHAGIRWRSASDRYSKLYTRAIIYLVVCNLIYRQTAFFNATTQCLSNWSICLVQVLDIVATELAKKLNVIWYTLRFLAYAISLAVQFRASFCYKKCSFESVLSHVSKLIFIHEYFSEVWLRWIKYLNWGKEKIKAENEQQ